MAAHHSVQMTDLVRVPSWVRVLDVICVLLACLAAVVALSGGFRLHLGAIRIGVTTPWPPLLWSLGVGVARHVVAPQQPLYREFPLLLAAWARVPAVRVAVAALVGTRPIILFVGYLAVFMFGYAEGHAPLRHFTNELLNLPVRWDAGWYLQIVTDGYQYSPLDTTTQQNIRAFTIDASDVYWTNEGIVSTVMRQALSGGTPIAIASDQHEPYAIAVDAGYVYWTTYSGTVMSAPRGGGRATTLAEEQCTPCAIAVNDSSIYWIRCGDLIRAAKAP